MSSDVNILPWNFRVFRVFIFLLNLISSNALFFDSTNETNFDNVLGNSTTPPFPEYLVTEPTKPSFSYRKCTCNLQEKLNMNNGSCLPISISEAVNALQKVSPTNKYDITDFILSSVEIVDLDCPSSRQLLEVTEEEFFILESGELYIDQIDVITQPGEFCFELLDNGNEGLHPVAKTCAPLPRIPLCSRDEQISSNPSVPISLNVSFANSVQLVESFEFYGVSMIECEEYYQYRSLELNGIEEDIHFEYFSGYLQLIWNPPFPATLPQLKSETDYCLKPHSHDLNSYTVEFCYEDPVIKHERTCEQNICVRKCCPDQYIFNLRERKCSQYSNIKNNSFAIFHDFNTKQVVNEPSGVVFEYAFPWCKPEELYIIDPITNRKDEFLLLHNGSIYIGLSELVMGPSQYCIDNFLESSTDELNVKAISCFTKPVAQENKCLKVHKIMYPILIAISCVFLSITLLVYAVVPEFRTKLHGKSLISHVSSLLVAFFCQLIVSWNSSSLSMTGCKIIGKMCFYL